MPAPRANGPKSSAFVEMYLESEAAGERNDCAVKAVALLTDTPWTKVRDYMNAAGRKPRRGTPWPVIMSAIRHFGYEPVLVASFEFIRRYRPNASVHSMLHVTTHHPDRFNRVWKDGCRYLLDTRTHVAAVIDGVNHDWTKGRAKRVRAIFKIVKQESVK